MKGSSIPGGIPTHRLRTSAQKNGRGCSSPDPPDSCVLLAEQRLQDLASSSHAKVFDAWLGDRRRETGTCDMSIEGLGVPRQQITTLVSGSHQFGGLCVAMI